MLAYYIYIHQVGHSRHFCTWEDRIYQYSPCLILIWYRADSIYSISLWMSAQKHYFGRNSRKTYNLQVSFHWWITWMRSSAVSDIGALWLAKSVPMPLTADDPIHVIIFRRSGFELMRGLLICLALRSVVIAWKGVYSSRSDRLRYKMSTIEVHTKAYKTVSTLPAVRFSSRQTKTISLEVNITFCF